jgi:pimeloyl-ACP methyl ester carboxylesterase
MSLIDIRHRQLHIAISSPTPTANNDKADRTVFFIHGSMASLEQWRFQIEAIKPLYRVISYDYFGCGNSPRLENSYESYSTEEHLADLLVVFDKFKTRQNFIVGHSFGSSQVCRLAKLRETEVHGCVLIAPAIFPDGGHPLFRLPELVLRWIQPYLSDTFMKMALHPTTREAKTPAHKELLEVAIARSNKNSMHVAKSFYRQIKFVKKEEVTSINGRIPFLIICGSADMITPMTMSKDFLTWLQERSGANQSSTKFEIVGPASHQVMEEQPEAVNEILREFLNECSNESTSLSLSSL